MNVCNFIFLTVPFGQRSGTQNQSRAWTSDGHGPRSTLQSSFSPRFFLPIAAGLLLYGSAIALIIGIATSVGAAQPADGAATTSSTATADRCINIPARYPTAAARAPSGQNNPAPAPAP